GRAARFAPGHAGNATVTLFHAWLVRPRRPQAGTMHELSRRRKIGERFGPALARHRAMPRLPSGREREEGRSPFGLRDVPQLSPAERPGGRAATDRATITRK